MTNNLGAQIGSSVGDAVAAKLEPVLERIGSSAGTEVTGLVSQLGDSIFEKLNASLDEVSKTLNGMPLVEKITAISVLVMFEN
ncbi:MAG: hypothetical protein P8M25_12005 [Paracoccaceae bacterium]|nr:hypothetical protein [Paracoccaceae bacterium]